MDPEMKLARISLPILQFLDGEKGKEKKEELANKEENFDWSSTCKSLKSPFGLSLAIEVSTKQRPDPEHIGITRFKSQDLVDRCQALDLTRP